ncbi:MAG: PDDEXK nuclease domain-containing protein [Candidatus Desantisbacteria bacterium]
MSKEILKKTELFHEIKSLINEARNRVAIAVNAELSMLYWHIGRRINTEILHDKRAEYGKQIIANLSKQLTSEFGNGWSEKQLRHCLYTVETFPDVEIFSTLCRQFSWSHIKELIYIQNSFKRDFYIEITKLEHWSVRQLRERINSLLFERTAISRKPEETIIGDLKTLREQGELSADLVFRDPYFLDFLGLSDSYSEKDIESAIIVELQRFIIELGQDFAFLARQKRITVDNRDYYIDLLFYHRRLKCLVVIDLKIGDFEAAFKGQMELYLRYLEKYEMVKGENTPIGLILCAGKNEEHIELLQLHKSNIRVADYLTQLPPREILQAKFHKAIEIARNRLITEVSNECRTSRTD